MANVDIEREIATPRVKRGPARRENGRWAGYWHLLIAGWRSLIREPEVIFWVFVFPILLALGLGLATPNKPAATSRVAVVEGPGAARALDLLKASSEKGVVHAETLSAQDAWNTFRLGKHDLVVTPQADGSFEYRYDPARNESLLARVAVEDAMQSAAGRKDPLLTSVHVIRDHSR